MFQKQAIMRRVIYALIPMYLFALYLYGFSLLLHTLLIFATGIGIEYFMTKRRNKKVSEAVLVTCMLYTLSLPPNTPFWISVLGIAFAIFVAKEIYGGFGRNVFNPAIAGRMFIYLTFPTVLTTAWMVPGIMGSSGINNVDAITAATPLALLRQGTMPNLSDLFLGFRAGSFGESSTLLIILAGIYLMVTKTANWRLILSSFLGALICAVVFFITDLIPGLSPGNTPFFPAIAVYMMSGSLLYMVVFMVTDPVSAPNKPHAQYAYGLLIGSVTIVVRTFSVFPEGTSFGILVGNVFACFFDEIFGKKKAKKQTKQPAPPAESRKQKEKQEVTA